MYNTVRGGHHPPSSKSPVGSTGKRRHLQMNERPSAFECSWLRCRFKKATFSNILRWWFGVLIARYLRNWFREPPSSRIAPTQ